MSPELIGSIFSGLVLFVGALATFTAARQRRVAEDARTQRRQIRGLQKRYLAAVGHMFVLEVELAQRNIPVPARPALLEADDDDDEPVPPTPAVPPQPQPGTSDAAG